MTQQLYFNLDEVKFPVEMSCKRGRVVELTEVNPSLLQQSRRNNSFPCEIQASNGTWIIFLASQPSQGNSHCRYDVYFQPISLLNVA